MKFSDNPTILAHHKGFLAFDTDDSGRLTEIVTILSVGEQVSAATDDEILALETELREIADRILDGSAEGIDRNDTERLTEIAESLDTIRTEAAARVAAGEERQAEVDALMERIRAEAAAAEDGDEDDGEAADEGAEGESADEAGEAEDDAEESEGADDGERVVVTASASAPTLAEIAARVPRTSRPRAVAPSHTPGGTMLARTEHPFIRALERGQNVSLGDLAEIMVERYGDFAGMHPGAGEQKIRLGRVSLWDAFPEDRILRASDTQFVNDAKIDAVVAGADRADAWSDAIVASGGFCAPTPADYDIVQISGSQRPVRDSLPRFLADRGGIRFTPPPDLSDVLVDQTGGAIGEWSNVTDLTPGESTKTTQSISCNTVTEVLTKAIYRSLGFGNFGARAYPEHVRVWTLNAAAAWARKAEQELLDEFSSNSTAITSTGVYGYVSELLTHIIQLSAGERSRQRMDPESRLRVLLPAWVPAQMQIDYLRQGSVETRLRSLQELRAMFALANVNVTFYEDQRSSSGQVVGAQAAAELRDLPEICEWYLFHEGAYQFLDGGELDLGLVRDSTLNQTNDFRIFAENWEGLAYRGIFSYRVRSTLCPSGDRQVAVDGDPCGAS